MENELQLFNFESNNVRVVMINNKPWFVGKDIADILEYARPSEAVKKHVPDRYKLTRQISVSGQKRNMTVLSEPGVYKLVFKSTMPLAEEFGDWIAEEVLPSIRKTGTYSVVQPDIENYANMTDSEKMFKMAEIMKQKEEANLKIEMLTPIAKFAEDVITSNGTFSTRTVAGIFSMTAQRLNKLLKELHIQYGESGVYHLYAEHLDKGYATIKQVKVGSSGTTNAQLRWTNKGILFIYLVGKEKNVPELQIGEGELKSRISAIVTADTDELGKLMQLPTPKPVISDTPVFDGKIL